MDSGAREKQATYESAFTSREDTAMSELADPQRVLLVWTR
jgi:hypothetical protein